MTKLKILALLVGMVMLFAIPATVSAQRVPPHVFVVTSVDGAAPVDGTVIVALVDGTEAASETTSGGSATITVDQGDSSFAGMTVTFTVNGATVAETAAWTQGGADIMELTGGAPLATEEPSGEAIAGPAGPAGPQGPQGRRGAPGADGSDGSDGSDGARGAAGAAGSAGSAGSDGSDGSAGAQGPAGPAGAPGAAGADGEDGSSALGVVALILAIIALVGAGGAFMLGRRS